MRMPDPTTHFYVSLAKSIIRILAGGCIATGSLFSGGMLLVLAELLGILEEIL